jgi:bifunctional DNA primase/polymerase-like protein/primase-like protein
VKLKAALAAQGRRFSIFPVSPNGKTPHRLAGQWGATATADVNQIVHFWTQVDPNANIGIACKPSQLLVVDLDQPKEDWNLRGTEWEYVHQAYGPRVSGEDLLDEMAYKLSDSENYHDDFDTYTVRTGSGGLHLYYWWPESWPRISQASPVKGTIDVRGNGGQWGGYVLGEGSTTEAGSYFELRSGKSMRLPPEWIRLLVAEKPQPPRVHRPLAPQQSGLFSWGGLAHSVSNAAEGNRNNALLWAARAMCGDGAAESEAQSVLGAAARQAGLGDFEIERTIQSAYRIQQQKGRN